MLAEIVVVGVHPDGRFQGVISLGVARLRGPRRPHLPEHEFGELGPRLLVFATQPHVADVEAHGLFRSTLLGSLSGEGEEIVGVAIDLELVDRIHAPHAADGEDSEDDQEFEVDRLHDASLSASWADPFGNILSVAANWGEGAGRLESLKV